MLMHSLPKQTCEPVGRANVIRPYEWPPRNLIGGDVLRRIIISAPAIAAELRDTMHADLAGGFREKLEANPQIANLPQPSGGLLQYARSAE